MLRESGRVVALEERAVWVETIKSSLCGSCAARSGCGHGVLARASRNKGLIRAVETDLLAASCCQVGDEVDIELPESVVLKGSLLLYLLPLLLAIAVSTAAEPLGEGVVVALFGLALGAGFLLVKWISARPGLNEQFEPRLAAIRNKSDDVIVSG